jgi:hypothetical protein
MADLNEEVHKVGIISLPNNMLMEVLTKVASSSFTDLFKSKLTCRDLCGLIEEDHIFQQVSLEKINPHSWCTNVEVMFLSRCKESRNPDAIFREGMHGYFTSKNPELGLKLLEKTYEKGHIEASYIYSVILICHGGQLKHQGLQILSSLLFCMLRGSRIKDCWRRIKGHVQGMYINNHIAKGQEPYYHVETCRNGITTNSLVARQSE